MISYLFFDFQLETLFKKTKQGQPKFEYAFAVYLFQAVPSFLIARFWNDFVQKKGKTPGTPDPRNVGLKNKIVMGVCNFGSVFFGNSALAHVSYPLHVMMKSSKTISIILVSFVLGRKNSHSLKQTLCAGLITAGILNFNFNQDSGKANDKSSDIIGIVLILLALFSDGFLADTQTELKKTHKVEGWDLMELICLYSGLISLGYAVISTDIFGFISYVQQYPDTLNILVRIGITGTIGQIFIFHTISNFSPLILSMITTTRKFLSVIFSIIVNGHSINLSQGLSIAMVFTGVYIELLSNTKKSDGAKTAVSDKAAAATPAKEGNRSESPSKSSTDDTGKKSPKKPKRD